MARISSYGKCELCGSRVGKAAMKGHLAKCLADHGGQAASPALLIRVQAAGDPMYWLDLAVKPEATLKDVDTLLRRIWLECCGHLSEFYFGAHEQVGMSRKVDSILGAAGSRVGYVYDFGSSTELVVSHGAMVNANLGRRVTLVARNEPPVWKCVECEAPAINVCTECIYEGEGFLCSTHSEDHECGDDMFLPVVNSPRMGVCGYTGED